MGEQNVASQIDEERTRAFMRAVLTDVWALEQLLNSGKMETGVYRIGAEQEMFLVDSALRPASISAEILRDLSDSRFTTELARFNLEANVCPLPLTGPALRLMEAELTEMVTRVRGAAARYGADVLLAGILPTLTVDDLTLAQITDAPRYHELNRMLIQSRGGKFSVHIKGLDEIHVEHDNMMLEACNTSFQVHLQVNPRDFVEMYNLAQAITAPMLAASVNSPLLFGRRLWAETRLALFQHSVDERSRAEQARARVPRVMFGQNWINNSVLEMFHQDIVRFRTLLTHAIDEDPAIVLSRGEIPNLSALRVFNGTVWRWNRACYGIIDGKPHLRIENRVLPSGPTVLDEMATAAFFYGLMMSLPKEYGPVDQFMSFDDAASNFYSAARHGLDAQFVWGGRSYSAAELILHHLMPLARTGLRQAQIDSEDISRYLNIFEERVRSRQTGARWSLKALASCGDQSTQESRCRTLTAAMLAAQKSGEPVHQWRIPDLKEADDWRQNFKTVGQFMRTNLYTVRPDDLIDLVASIMHWEHLRHVPVENHEGQLVGLVSQRDLLCLLAQGSVMNRSHVPVNSVMKSNPMTVTPETLTVDAINTMRRLKIGCLPVVREGYLVGMITQHDMLTIAGKLFEEELRKTEKPQRV